MKICFSVLFMLFLVAYASAQSAAGSITGKVIDVATNQPLPGVNVVIIDTKLGAATNILGEYQIQNVPAGRCRLRATLIGFMPQIINDVIVSSVHSEVVDFSLPQTSLELVAVTITSNYFRKDPVAVNSVTTLDYEEIRRSPGGFEDVVRALSVLPGIAQADPGRNDLIVRGGAPSENLYIVDDVVVPNINHFGSQGASGGPLSYIDLNYVKDVSFSTGGFAANYGDRLSSVMKIKLGEGRKDKFGGRAIISATQFGVNAEGPLSKDVNFLFSARRSYLDFIFRAAGLGFVPEYYDYLDKVTWNVNQSDQLSFLIVGAFDNVKFFNDTPDQRYSNSRALGNDQLQYMSALSFRHLFHNGFFNISVNRNFVDYKFSQKDTMQNPIFLNNSKEKENNLKADVVIKPSAGSEINAGLLYKFIQFTTDIKLPFFMTRFGDTLSLSQLTQNDRYNKLGAYVQYSEKIFPEVTVNGGVRFDYFSGINNPADVSPRISFLYNADAVSKVSLSTGIYYQAPSYIWLAGDRRNKDLKSIRSTHLVLGYERTLREDAQIRIECFYKGYADYPTSVLRPYLILVNTGAGFGGSEDNYSAFAPEYLVSQGKGNVRGIELLIQKKASDIPVYGLLSVTYSKSDFTALDGVTRSGSFDQRFIFNISGGYIINDNWEAAVKFRLSTGRPYTPFNSDGSQSISDYNSERFATVHSLDVRVDRRWDFGNFGLVAYIDIQNIYNRKNVTSVIWDDRKNRVENHAGLGILPSIGVNLEF
ncbi:MAG: TonB-dependent receptor [Ignavibacteria bacterium]